MKQLIDINDGKKKAKTRFIIHLVLVITFTVGIIAGSLLLLFLSTLDYIPNLIITIIIDALLIIFLLFYFFNIFPVVLYYHKLFKGMTDVSLEHRRHMVFIEEKENKVIDNVKFRVLDFAYKEGESEYREHLYVLDSDVTFTPQESYRLDTYQNIIVRFEEISHATN